MKAQTLYRGESKGKEKLTKVQKLDNFVQKMKRRADALPKKEATA